MGINIPMPSKNYYRDSFRQDFEKSTLRDLFTNARTVDTNILLRSVDAEQISKSRALRMGMECRAVRRMDKMDMEEEWRQKMRSRRDLADKSDRFEFDLAEMQLLPKIYFDTFGVGHNGSPCIDNDDHWTCGHCGTTFQTTLASLPMHCEVCGHQTPVGDMVEYGVFSR